DLIVSEISEISIASTTAPCGLGFEDETEALGVERPTAPMATVEKFGLCEFVNEQRSRHRGTWFGTIARAFIFRPSTRVGIKRVPASRTLALGRLATGGLVAGERLGKCILCIHFLFRLLSSHPR